MRSCDGPTGQPVRYEKRRSAQRTGSTVDVKAGAAARLSVTVTLSPIAAAASVTSAIRIAAIYSEAVLALAVLASTFAAACPQNLASGLETPATARQLVTVEAKVARTTYATLRTWRRVDGCWVAAAGAYSARLGRNGLSSNRREGDGTTPTGTYRIGRTMYGNEANPGVRFRYRRLRCGDWWDEDPSSPTYNSFQHVRCGDDAAVRRRQRGHVAAAAAVSLSRGDRVQHAPRRPRQGLRDLPARADRRTDDRLHLAAEGPAARGAALAAAGRRAGDRDRDEPGASRLKARAAAGSLLFLVVAPGTVAGLIPWWLTGWEALPFWLPARILGVALIAAGVVVLLSAFVRFVAEGVGTPAPVAPPERLVVGGLYRYVRNPMYLAVTATIVGQALALGQVVLLVYVACFALVVYAFVRWYEEPTLRRRFGDQYEEYRRSVPGWWPRRRHTP